jgi:hypothetical protein
MAAKKGFQQIVETLIDAGDDIHALMKKAARG